MLSALILASALVPAVPSDASDVEAVARAAASMPSYTFVLRRELSGIPKRAERLDTITGCFVAGKPLQMRQGNLEVYTTHSRVALREGDGEWGLVDFRNPFRSRGASAPNWLTGKSASANGVARVDGKEFHAASSMARIQAAQLARLTAPHELLTRLGDCLENVQTTRTVSGKKIITGTLNEESAKAYQPSIGGGGRARFRGQGGAHWTTKATVHVVVGTDGYPEHYDLTVNFRGSKQGHPFEQTKQSFVDISKVANTSVKLPEDVERMFAD